MHTSVLCRGEVLGPYAGHPDLRPRARLPSRADGGVLVVSPAGGFVQLLGFEHVGVELADEVDVAMETLGVDISCVVVTINLVDQNLVAVDDALGRDETGREGEGR